ncbi:hypothetical protein CLV84_1743 [Neolewinella xylanilytica]|uniref:Tetratricopeptide repeat protein n=1 Tax=Neolewinella xylanilytica TaxID=1514080 RepID=A0A2S6IB87_9BACT|nr:hypothetical protein [Neolewinella xylanilytica]PPK88771.1 hypothetical protein CLV84_1743 [Neolewinella xylanilytica]
MSTNPHSNAAVRRLRQVQRLYTESVTTEAGRLMLWIAGPEEKPMIEAFVLTEDSAGAVTRDLFLTFVQGNPDTSDYLANLDAEFRLQLESARDTLLGQGVPFEPYLTPLRSGGLTGFLRRIHSFAGTLTHHRGRTVVFLNPAQGRPSDSLATTLQQLLVSGLPAGLDVMVCDTEDGPLGRRFTGREDWHVRTLRPELHMDQLARELAAEGDPEDPAVRFRTLFLEMSQSGSRGAFDSMREQGEAARQLAQQQIGWEHLVATVLAAQGAHLLPHADRRKEAVSLFRQAREAAQLAIDVGNPAGRAVLLQCLNFEAAGLLHAKEYPAAAATYEEAAARADREDEAFQRMEAYRLAAWCFDRGGAQEQAWQCNLDALQTAETISPDLLRGSTLPYVGQALLEGVERMNRHDAIRDIRHRMERLVGADWEELIERAQTPATP